MAPGIWQIALIVLLILLLFGAGRLPRIMGDLAKGIKSFKSGLSDEEKEDEAKSAEKSDPKTNDQIAAPDEESQTNKSRDKEKTKT